MDYADFFDDEVVSLEQLEFIARNISMEAFTSPTFMVDARKRFSQFFTGATSYFSRFKLSNLSGIRIGPDDLDSFVARNGYVDSSSKTIIVPEGFVGQWVPYSQALKDAMAKATKLEAMIRAFNSTVGQIVQNPDALKNASGLSHSGPRTLDLDESLKSIGKTFFDGASNEISRSLGSVIERINDIKVTKANVADAIKYDKAHPAEKVQKAINRTMELAPALSRAIDSEPAASKTVVSDLVSLTIAMAHEVEAYGVLLYRITQFSNALKDSIKEIKK